MRPLVSAVFAGKMVKLLRPKRGKKQNTRKAVDRAVVVVGSEKKKKKMVVQNKRSHSQNGWMRGHHPAIAERAGGLFAFFSALNNQENLSLQSS